MLEEDWLASTQWKVGWASNLGEGELNQEFNEQLLPGGQCSLCRSVRTIEQGVSLGLQHHYCGRGGHTGAQLFQGLQGSVSEFA